METVPEFEEARLTIVLQPVPEPAVSTPGRENCLVWDNSRDAMVRGGCAGAAWSAGDTDNREGWNVETTAETPGASPTISNTTKLPCLKSNRLGIISRNVTTSSTINTSSWLRRS